MAKRLLDYDPVTKSKQVVHFEADGSITMHETADVADQIEHAKAMKAMTDERARWGDGHGDHVAKIPIHLYYALGCHRMSDEELLKFLDDPTWEDFRMRPGRLSR